MQECTGITDAGLGKYRVQKHPPLSTLPFLVLTYRNTRIPLSRITFFIHHRAYPRHEIRVACVMMQCHGLLGVVLVMMQCHLLLGVASLMWCSLLVGMVSVIIRCPLLMYVAPLMHCPLFLDAQCLMMCFPQWPNLY